MNFSTIFPMIDCSELFRLAQMLSERTIPFEINNMIHVGGYQLCYPKMKGCDCSVICHGGSYGHSAGLLEIMGLMTEEERAEACDDVMGWLTAEEVFERIVNHYNAEN